MRGDDVLGARFDSASTVSLVKGEAKSRERAYASTVREARDGLQRTGGLPSPHSLIQFAERLLGTEDDALGEAILELEIDKGVRAAGVTHLMFLFAGNDPSPHVIDDLLAYAGESAQRAMIVQVGAHPEFIAATFEKAIDPDA